MIGVYKNIKEGVLPIRFLDIIAVKPKPPGSVTKSIFLRAQLHVNLTVLLWALTQAPDTHNNKTSEVIYCTNRARREFDRILLIHVRHEKAKKSCFNVRP